MCARCSPRGSLTCSLVALQAASIRLMGLVSRLGGEGANPIHRVLLHRDPKDTTGPAASNGYLEEAPHETAPHSTGDAVSGAEIRGDATDAVRHPTPPLDPIPLPPAPALDWSSLT